jgi:hypothetical protein
MRVRKTPTTTTTTTQRIVPRSFYEYEPSVEADEEGGQYLDALAPELALASLVVDADDVIGRGSFSVCRAARYDGLDVVVKEYIPVRGRDVSSFYIDELETCRALKACEGVARFMGACGAERYLVWENVGATSLEMCLERGDGAFDVVRATLPGACESLDDADVYRFLCRSLAKSIAAVQANDFIHRDVKPANALLNEKDSTVVLCDLGACADVQTGRNMDGSEAIFDPVYGAPEQFRVLQGGFPSISVSGLFGRKKDGQSLGGTRELEASGVTPTPYFDAYSLGMTMLRLGVPSLRSPKAMAQARRDIDACEGDVQTWRDEVCARLPGVNDWSLVDGTGAWMTIRRLTAHVDERWSIQRALGADEFFLTM